MSTPSITNFPPGYPDTPDARGRARKTYGGTLFEFGKHGTPKSIQRYQNSPALGIFLAETA